MLSAVVERYVELMRACGFVFDEQARRLASFSAFAETRGETHVRVATVLDWSRRARTEAQRRIVYMTVRKFALAAVTEDAQHEVPPPDLLPRTARQRPAPYIYSNKEIAALLSAAERTASTRCRVPIQYKVLFGLIAATGLRISEALGLDIADVTPDGLLIREAKRRGWRILPLHPSVGKELSLHLARRQRVHVASNAIFLGERGGRMCHATAYAAFVRMLEMTGLKAVAKGGQNPRIHDLRHTFAVRSLEACEIGRDNVARHMVALSTWLGHVNIADTYWYLEGTPTLLGRIADRVERFAAGELS